jgi:CopA family copper-resistance protein
MSMALPRPNAIDLRRRRFVTGLAAGGVLAGLGWGRRASPAGNVEVPVLRGTDLHLTVGELPVNFTGAPRLATVVNGSLPAPILRLREGDDVRLRVSNTLAHDTSIHWHGIILPSEMDGVPGLSFAGIAPGTSYDYRFTLRQSGTYWYHAHSAFQEQTGLYGALIVDPREPEPFEYDREHVILLSDWSDLSPERIFDRLKKQGDYFNRQRLTAADLLADARAQGWRATLADRAAWGRMRMSATDRADVTGATYTYLMNGTAPAGNWTGLHREGERVRLRFINGSAMTIFDVRIPGLPMTVVAADGVPVHPVTTDEFRLSVAETLDVIVKPAGGTPYTVFAQSIDRSGYARGTLAPRPGLEAPVPALDRPTRLTMADMGHGDHGGHAGDSAASATADPHVGHGASPAGDAHADHSAHGAQVAASADRGIVVVEHPRTERGPGTDMQVSQPATRLDDPGIGLRAEDLHRARAGHSHGHRVLTLADLRSLAPLPYASEPGRTLQLHLTGHMERYVFSFDGVRFGDAAPIRLRHGEVVRIALVNDTMMEHPIHLHGMWSDVEDERGGFLVRKHTLSVPPASLRTYRVHADALGRWAYHCHLLYHMEAGMFREVQVW